MKRGITRMAALVAAGALALFLLALPLGAADKMVTPSDAQFQAYGKCAIKCMGEFSGSKYDGQLERAQPCAKTCLQSAGLGAVPERSKIICIADCNRRGVQCMENCSGGYLTCSVKCGEQVARCIKNCF